MSVHEVLRILRAQRLTIVLCTVVAGIAAVTLVQLATPVYQASSSVYFSLPSATSGNDLSQGANYTQAQMLSYAELVDQPIVLQPVIAELSLPYTLAQLAQRVTAQASANTVVIQLTVSDTSPTRAAAVANAVSRQLIATSGDLSPRTTSGDPAIKGTVVAVAATPRFPASPRKKRDLVAALLAGLILGGLIALVRARADTRVRTAADITSLTAVPVMGEVVASPVMAARGTLISRTGREAEAFRRIRTNLEFLTLEASRKDLVVTSALSGEGKSTTCIRLGVALAEAGLQVLVVDADLRRPSIASYLGLEPSVGLTTALVGKAALADLVQPTALTSLHALTSGAIPPNPAELLGSDAMRQLLAVMNHSYDVVLLDSPPLLAVTDAAVLSKMVTSTVLVAGCDKVRQPELVEALATLETISSKVIGIVANRVHDAKAATYEPYPSATDGSRTRRADVTPVRRLLARRGT